MADKLTNEEIKEINNSISDSWNQGIFTEPNWIPNNVKEPVIYMRWSPGGISGGSCWDDSDPQPYYNEDIKPRFEALDKVLMKLCPNISYLQYKDIEALIKRNSDTEWEYYGNCTEWNV